MKRTYQRTRRPGRASLSLYIFTFTVAGLLLAPPGEVSHSQRGHDRQLTQTAPVSKRMALVIGNGSYANAPSLKNPPNDAADMADALSDVGFSVERGINLTQRQMKSMIRALGQRLKGGGQGLFYFAGHGVQLRGHNYLIPVDADIRSEADVEDQGVDVNLVLGLMDEADNGLNVVILDACRNNPFARSFRSAASGLAQLDAPTGTLIAYATAPGSIAGDGQARNGLYTQELLKYIRTPGMSVEEILKQVRINVRGKTQGKQVPWESSSLTGDFYFTGGREKAGSVAARPERSSVDASAMELSFWDSVKNSSDPGDFEAYLDQYPNGTFAGLARRRVQSLRGSSPSGLPPNSRQNLPGQVVKTSFFTFNLQLCKISGTTVTCDLTITNDQNTERNLKASTRARTSQLIDDLGNESGHFDIQIANQTRGSSTLLVPNLSVKAVVSFEDVSPQARVIKLLKLLFIDSGSFGRITVEFRDVPLAR
jgi:Caspase domain